MGVDQRRVSDWLRGKHRPTKSSTKNICREFGINEGWLTKGVGPIYKKGLVRKADGGYEPAVIDVSGYIPEDIPVVGRVGGGRGEFLMEGDPVGQGYKMIHRPFDLRDPNAFGVEVKGDSMSPRYEEGDIVICSPKTSWKKTGDYCVVVTNDDESVVKKVKEENGHLILSSLAPGYEPYTLPKQSVRAVHKIVWKKES